MDKKLTPWFQGDVKPARVGVYTRDDSDTDCDNGLPAYSHWNGSRWGHLCGSKDIAQRNVDYVSAYQSLPWRGLASDPKASKP